MEEVVVGAVVRATIQVVLQNLLCSPMEEIGLIWNFNKDLQKLKKSLLMIRDLLEDAEKKQVTDKAVQRWLMNLEAVVYEADYLFDQLNYQRLRKRGSTTTKKVSSFFSDTTFRYGMARKIKQIKNETKSINQEAAELGLQMRIATSHAVGAGTGTPPYLESDSFSVDPIFIGRENDMAKIVEMVINSPTEEVVSVLPIVGMGGVGKTTLTRKVYNDATIISHFEKRLWVHVSQNNFDTLDVLKEIGKSLTEENVVGSREIFLQKLQKCLGNKKYLLVLDNVWNESDTKWQNLMSSLKGISSVKGNVIVVTTRSINVAYIVKTLDIHEIGVLSKHDCWLIIKAKTFGGEGVPSTLETAGLNIAKKCGGLPLAAQVVGGLLRGKPKHEWASIEKNWILSYGGEGSIVSNVLKLSFDHLSSPTLKKCSAFCSIIPKSWWIYKDEMIQLWMAEGLLQTDEEKDMEIVGNKVFNILLQSSLLQVVRRDNNGNVERFNMHDLVHDLASSILISKFIDGAHPIRYMSRSYIDESSPILEEHAKCLRALFFTGKISNKVFSNLTRLHVLIHKDNQMTELPNEIGKLISLRYLDISHTKIECLPDSIGDLYLLQTLRATIDHNKPSYLKKLPDTFKFLCGLIHLYIPNIKLPLEIGKLTSLRTLPYFQVGNEKGCRIMELGSLKNLTGEIEIHNLERVCDKEEAKTADLYKKTNILKLKLIWSESREDKFPEDLHKLTSLEKSKIMWCPNLKSIAYPRGRHGFTSLCGLHFVNCSGLTSLPCEMLESSVHSLKKLDLSRSTSITNFPQVMRFVQNMSSLTLLGIACVPKLHEVVEEIGSLSSLQYLVIGGSLDCLDYVSFNGILDRIFPSLKSLRMLVLIGMEDWDALPDQLKHLTSLYELALVDFGIEVLPEWFERLSSPRYLALRNFQKLRQLPSRKAMQGLTQLAIIKCPLLKQNLEEGTGDDSEWSKVSHIHFIEMDGLPFSRHA